MRTVTTDTCTTPSLFLAIDSEHLAHEISERLADLHCHCTNSETLDAFELLLDSQTPTLAVISLESAGCCALDFCRKHPLLLSSIPVVFVTNDPREDLEKCLMAVRQGALDVIASPLDSDKLERLASYAHQRIENDEFPSSARFLVPASSVDEFGAGPVVSVNQSGWDSAASLTVTKVSDPSDFPEILPSRESAQRKASYNAYTEQLKSWILGSSPAMQSVRSIIAEVADTNANVMIYGASGTGKELVATSLHKLSGRRDGPFEPVNMTEIPHDLAESLLFGHEKGAFTGADTRQIGVCEAADGGTLFLDEIGEMALQTQPKLLRFLQEGTVKRVGSRTNKKVDVRVITATNRPPETIVKEGLMREDLFFRLHVVPIYIPPLQDRPEDIEQLAMHFLRQYVKAYKRSISGFTRAALDVFRLHDWPGNVRQLANVVERLVVFAKSNLIDVPDIPAEIHAASMFGESASNVYTNGTSAASANGFSAVSNQSDGEAASAIASMSAIQRTERAAIIEALQRSGGHVIDAAHLLGLGQATVYRKIKQYHIPHQRRRRRRSPK